MTVSQKPMISRLIFLVTFNVLPYLSYGLQCDNNQTIALLRFPFIGLQAHQNVVNTYSIPNHSNRVTYCSDKCSETSKCESFTLEHYKCWLHNDQLLNNQQLISNLTKTSSSSHYSQVCVPQVQNNTKLWRYEGTVGLSVDQSHILLTESADNFTDCLRICDTHKLLGCKAVLFHTTARNCAIADTTKRANSSAFAEISSEFIYFENSEFPEIENCQFAKSNSTDPSMAILQVSLVLSRKDCEDFCTHIANFTCRMYSFNETDQTCQLYADDSQHFSTLTQPIAANLTQLQTFYARGMCTRVVVTCTPSSMIATFSLSRPFSGKVYARSNPDGCSLKIENRADFNITLNTLTPELCGITEENKETFAAYIMLQFDDIVNTFKDKLFKLVCSFDKSAQVVENFVELRRNNFSETQTKLTPLVVTGGGPFPQALLQIVNRDDQIVTSADVGETLFAEVILKDSGLNTTYGAFVNNCEAFDGTVKHTLIDDSGCPTDANIFEGFQHVYRDSMTVLRAAFQGFKFQNRKRISVTCNVNFCYRFCDYALCTDGNGVKVKSFGKRRRRNSSKYESTRKFDVVTVDTFLDSR